MSFHIRFAKLRSLAPVFMTIVDHAGLDRTIDRPLNLGHFLEKCLQLHAKNVISNTMNTSHLQSPISDLLRRTIAESGFSYNSLEKETGVTRASIMRFVRGDQYLRLDMADRLASFFDLELRKRG